MGWKDDKHGKIIKASEVKLYLSSHTYAMKLSQLYKQEDIVRIASYSLPDIEYIKRQLGRRPNRIYLLCNSKFENLAKQVKETFPDIRVAIKRTCHLKLLLIEPDTVYLGSENFGDSHWDEVGVGIRAVAAHDWYLEEYERLWNSALEIL